MTKYRISSNLSVSLLLFYVCLFCQACHEKSEADVFSQPTKACCQDRKTADGSTRVTVETECNALKQIQTEVVGQHSLAFVIEATGELQPNANAVTRVSAPITGKVAAVHASVGDYVKPGQVIATITSQEIGNLVTDLFKTETEIETELSKDLLEIDCDLKQNEAELTLCQKQYDRAKLLIDEKIGSQAGLEAAQTMLEKHRLTIAALEEKKTRIKHVAEERVRMAGVAIEQRLSVLGMPERTIRDVLHNRTLVTSVPIETAQAGFILERNVNPGELVDPSRMLFVVDDIDSLWLVADIFERDVQYVKRGELIEFTVDSFPKQTFRGKLDFVGGSMNPETRTLAVRALIPNPGMKLKPKMFARMKILAGHHQALSIPKSAVQDAGSDKVVYVPVSNTEYIERKVVLGEEADHYVEVLDGLKPGERIVAKGACGLRSQCLKQER